MGADFILSGCPDPVVADGVTLDPEARHRILCARIEQLEEELLAELADYYLFIDVAEADDWRSEVRRQLASFLDVFTEHWRDTTSFLVGERWWVLAGGMTGGDSPSDSYDKLAALSLTGITEEPLRPDELPAQASGTATSEED